MTGLLSKTAADGAATPATFLSQFYDDGGSFGLQPSIHSEDIGLKADSTYTGSGAASVISILKGMFAQLATLVGYPVNNQTARLLAATADLNQHLVKNSAGSVVAIQGYNAKTGPVYLKLYNKGSAAPSNSDTPIKTLYVPASSAFAFDFPVGVYCSNGIGYAITGGAADNDNTNLVAGDVVCLNIDYN